MGRGGVGKRHAGDHAADRHPEQVAAGQQRAVVRFAMMLH
jgi:hypothetical protein